MRLPVNHALAIALVATLTCGGGLHARSKTPPPPVTGPAADYPVVVGAPFQIGTTTHTPEDRLTYDAVGYAEVETEGAGGRESGTTISAAHKTLPLPAYVEVTSLDSGRTILVRVERRGPMVNDRLIALSPGAAAQLGLAGSARPAVRVRRVNPPEQERAMLRTGGRAPERMATPKGLLDALNRKLGAGTEVLSAPTVPRPMAHMPTATLPATGAPTAAPKPAPTASAAPRLAPKPAPKPGPKPAPSVATPPVVATPRPATPLPAPPPSAAAGALIVQVAAFSTRDRASSVAGKLGGAVSPSGRVWRVRLGPFATRAQADAALAKARGAGYSDARIQRAD